MLYSLLLLAACATRSADGKESEKDGDKESPSARYQTDKDGWLTVLNDAYAESLKRQKPILAYFTASDTCRQCKQLETEVFPNPLFKTWSEKNVVLFKIDNPSQPLASGGNEDQTAAMIRSLNISTYPTVWILGVTHEPENGRFKVKPIGYTGYHTTPEKLLGVLQNFVRG